MGEELIKMWVRIKGRAGTGAKHNILVSKLEKH